jgi:hypothetical protein
MRPAGICRSCPGPGTADAASGGGQGLAEPVQVALVVFFAKEAGFTVVAALHDVQGDTIKLDARTTGHEDMLRQCSEKCEPGPFDCSLVASLIAWPL